MAGAKEWRIKGLQDKLKRKKRAHFKSVNGKIKKQNLQVKLKMNKIKNKYLE